MPSATLRLGLFLAATALILASCASTDTPAAVRAADVDERLSNEPAAIETQPTVATTAALQVESTTTTAPTTTTIPEFDEVWIVPANDATGLEASTPVAPDIASALEILAPGGSIVIAPGTHAPVELVGYVGDPQNPLRIVGAEGAVLRGASHRADAALRIADSSHVVVENLQLERALWGLMIEASQNIVFEGGTVHDIGQEAIRVRNGSSQIRIEGNTIFDTGLRSDIATANGEGIYIGTGSPSGVDAVDDVQIINNDISRTADEAIDIKRPATNVTISGNYIHNIATGTSGAVVIHLNSPSDVEDPRIIFERNIIEDVTRTSPYRDGNCIVAAVTLTIVNNVLDGCQHRGIYLTGEAGVVTIQHNTLIETGEIGPIVQDHSNVETIVQNNLGVPGEDNLLLNPSDLVNPGEGDYRVPSEAVNLRNAPFIGIAEDSVGTTRSDPFVTFGAFE